MTLSRRIFTQLTKILQLDWTQGDRLAFFLLTLHLSHKKNYDVVEW